jgi:hypothetical protein
VTRALGVFRSRRSSNAAGGTDAGTWHTTARLPNSRTLKLQGLTRHRGPGRSPGTPGPRADARRRPPAPGLGSPGADPVLDDRAKAELRARLANLASHIDQAEERNDLDRAEHLRGEPDALLHHLAAATGLGGRSRRLGDQSSVPARRSVPASGMPWPRPTRSTRPSPLTCAAPSIWAPRAPTRRASRHTGRSSDSREASMTVALFRPTDRPVRRSLFSRS